MSDGSKLEEERLERYAAENRRKSLIGVLAARSGWRPNTAEWHVCDFELQRRLNFWNTFRSWLGVGIALLSLVIAGLAFFMRS